MRIVILLDHNIFTLFKKENKVEIAKTEEKVKDTCKEAASISSHEIRVGLASETVFHLYELNGSK